MVDHKKFLLLHWTCPSFKICNFIIQYVRVEYCVIFRKIVLYNAAGKRGETLKHVIFAIIAFILAVPILLILPVGLSWSGKIAALIIALLLSLLALAAKPFFPMWQLVLLLGMLMIAATYLLHRQFAHVFYATNKIDDNELEEQDEPSSFSIDENNDDALRMEEEARVDGETAPQNVLQTNAAVEPNEIITVDELPLESAADIEQIEITAEHEFPWENEKNTEQSEMAAINELPSVAAADERQTEAGSKSELPWETVDNDGINEAEKFDEWPFEIETNRKPSTDIPFAELPPAVTPEMEENLTVVDGVQETAARDGEENRLHISPEEWMMSTDSLVGEENGGEWDDILSEVVQQPFFSDDEETLKGKADAAAQEAQPAEWNLDVLPQGNDEEVIDTKGNNVDATENVFAISPVQSEILQTVAAELQLNRKYMDPLEYEQRIIQCLQSPLPDYGYYVFACLLVEHYLLEKQYDKLELLLAQLKEKFHLYVSRNEQASSEFGHSNIEAVAEKAESKEVLQALREKQIELLKGKRVTKDIVDKNGNTFIEAGTILTEEHIQKAQEEGPSVIVDILMNVEA
jgi:hypothetical protein